MQLTSPRARQRIRKQAAASLAFAVALGVGVPAHADNLKDRQKRTQHRVHQLMGSVDDSSSQVIATTKRLHIARARLEVARQNLRQAWQDLSAARVEDAAMAKALEESQARLAAAQAAVTAGIAKVHAQHKFVGDLVVQNYETGDPALLGFTQIVNAKDPADVIRQSEAMSVAMSDQNTAYDDLLVAQAELRQNEADVAAATQEVAKRRAAAAAHLVQTRQLALDALAARDHFRAKVTIQARARSRAIAARRQDAAALRQARAQERKIQQLILHRARLAAMRRGGGYQGDTSGLLERPVPGYITSPYGWRIHPIYGYWGLHDGDDFHAPCGTPLHAAGSGRVIAEYYSSVWGNRLYLNLGAVNGENVTVIYNHASSYRVSTGDTVSRGEVLGYAGTTGWSTGCHLHFTVDVNGSPVDPMTMIGS